MTREPPYQMAPTMPTAATTSSRGRENSSTRRSRRARSQAAGLSRSKRDCSRGSCPNAMTILRPVSDSRSSTESWALISWARRLIR